MLHTQPTKRQINLYTLLKFVATLLVLIFAFLMTGATAEAQDGMRLQIPSIGVDASVTTIHIAQFPNGQVTWDTRALRMNVGFLDGTSYIGTGGNTVLGGHSEVGNRTPDVFYQLDSVAIGDEIILSRGDEVRTYVVVNRYTVSEMDLSPIMPTNHEQLTLITCDIPSSDGVYYPQRDIVVAVPK